MTVNKINNKKYIGMCKHTHSKTYLGSGKLFKKALEKYGKDNFERFVIQECETFEELSNAEKYWIEYYNAVKSDEFYNLTAGGFGGNSEYLKEYWAQFSDEERKQIRKWKRNGNLGILNPMYGKKHSEETKRLIGSKSVNRKWVSRDMTGSKNPNSKRVRISINDVEIIYECLKDFSLVFHGLSYESLKNMAQTRRFNKKYNLKIEYV
jgi:group I intron endonuclease